MKIVQNNDRRPMASYTSIYPFIEPDESHIIEDEDSEWDGEEMGCIEVYKSGFLGLNYDCEAFLNCTIEQAEKLAQGILKAVEIARHQAAIARDGQDGAP